VQATADRSIDLPAGGEISPAALTALIALVHKHTGIAMTERKSVLLQGRLRPRLRALGLDGYPSYLNRIERDAAEVQVFINMVTTNDTAFFRTPHVWDYFSTQFLPTWTASNPGKTLKLWSAAAASGEEAYSIAMLCQEFQRSVPAFRYQILATDISTAVLAAAQAGVYGGRSVERMQAAHPALFDKYMSGDLNGVQVAPALKTQIRFAEHNLLAPLRPAEKFDIVFLRNVLIYFEPDVQKKVVDLVRSNMHLSSKLILGESESLGRLQTCYRSELPLVYGVASDAG
jgi:chemotaxis protein methyltransferase CheR